MTRLTADAVFLALADVPVSERSAFIDRHCGSNGALRAEVESMLATLGGLDDDFLDPSQIPTLDMAAADGPLQAGSRLGEFLVLQALGSGGMGVVYAAQQDRPRRTGRSWGRLRTCPPSSFEGRRRTSTHGPTCTRSVSCCSAC